MAQRERSGMLEQLMLLIVILIPLAGIVVYLLNQNGFFNSTASAPAPAAQIVPQTQAQPVASSAATLSVDDPSALPTAVSAGQIVPFSFTMQNSGDADAMYQYKVSVTWNSGEQDVIDVNSILLAKGQSKSIPESLKFETAPATANITIQIEPSGPSVRLTLPRAK